MRILENKKFTRNDVPIKNEQGEDLTTLKLIETVLTFSSYKTSAQVIMASKILSNLKENNGVVEVSDSDYAFIREHASIYQPLVSAGVTFADFFKQLE